MKMLISAAILSVLAVAPASAAMMACTPANMGKTINAMPPGPTPANDEMAKANMDMSKGDMRGACMHYARAQRMNANMMKSETVGMRKGMRK